MNLRSIVLAAATLTAACFGGGGQSECVATGTYNSANVRAVGTGSDAKANAEKGFCGVYCNDNDPTVDAAYRTWKASPEGQKSKASRWFDIDSAPALKQLATSCTQRCDADRAAGKIQVAVSCK